jgi:hypothetical protein
MQADRLFTNCELVTEWYGGWPSFHDSEVVAIRVHRSLTLVGGAPTLEADIHVFLAREVQGRICFDKHAVITLGFSDVVGLELSEFNQQNVLWNLEFEETGIRESPHRCLFSSSHGVECRFEFSSALVVALVPGAPEGSNYSSHQTDSAKRQPNSA